MKTPEYGSLNEFDEALLEMTNAVKEANPQNRVEMQKMVEGWVSIEDSEFCQDVMAAEVEELMDLDVLCDLKNNPQEDADEDKSDDEEVVGTYYGEMMMMMMELPRHPHTPMGPRPSPSPRAPMMTRGR